MAQDVLYATGFFEIGDQFYDGHGQLRTVTDVLLCHYLRRKTYKVLYEVDNSGEFIDLVFGYENVEIPQPAIPKPKEKPNLRLTSKPTNPNAVCDGEEDPDG